MSPSLFKERGRNKKEGSPALLNARSGSNPTWASSCYFQEEVFSFRKLSGPFGTVPELLFDKKGLIPALQGLIASYLKPANRLLLLGTLVQQHPEKFNTAHGRGVDIPVTGRYMLVVEKL